MTEEQLRESMRRDIDLGHPADALKQYNAFNHDSPNSILNASTIDLAELALQALGVAEFHPKSFRYWLAISVALIGLTGVLFVGRIHFVNYNSMPKNRWKDHQPTKALPNLQALLSKGDSLFQACNYEEALAIDSTAFRTAIRQSDEGASSTAISYVGRDFEALGRLKEARTSYSLALEIRSRIGPSLSIAYEEEIIGSLDVALGNFKDAKDELSDSLARRKAKNDGAGVIECQRDLADLCIANQVYNLAQVYLREATVGATKLNKPDMLAAIQCQQGTVASGLGDQNVAEKLLLSSLSYWRTKGQSRWIAETEITLSSVKLKQIKAAEALGLVQDSLSRLQHVGDKYGAAKAELAEAQVLKATGRKREAESLFRSALDYAHTSNLKPFEKRVEVAMR